jgi:hypothetical protein
MSGLLGWITARPTNTRDEAARVGEGTWRVKYDGTCSRCGTVLRAGDIAVYDRRAHAIHCVECPVISPKGPQPIDLGVAGASARREYEKRKVARDDRVRGRFGRRLGGVVLALTDEPQTTRAWATGARGEEKLARALDQLVGVTAIHDRRVPGWKGNIDHIVIAPAGISWSMPSTTRVGSRSATLADFSGGTAASTSADGTVLHSWTD